MDLSKIMLNSCIDVTVQPKMPNAHMKCKLQLLRTGHEPIKKATSTSRLAIETTLIIKDATNCRNKPSQPKPKQKSA